MTALLTSLNNLNSIYSIWHFNSYLRVTYIGPAWLVVWDHRHSPPQRYDFKDTDDHWAVCRMAAAQLQKLAERDRD
jgi:hypothetical protein